MIISIDKESILPRKVSDVYGQKNSKSYPMDYWVKVNAVCEGRGAIWNFKILASLKLSM